jgi:hypothetical protein
LPSLFPLVQLLIQLTSATIFYKRLLIKFEDLKICTPIHTFVIFVCSLKYKVFKTNVLHVCQIHHYL